MLYSLYTVNTPADFFDTYSSPVASIVVETSFENEKSVKLSSNYSRNLYLIDLVNFSLIKLNNDWSTIIDYELSEENNKLIIIQKSVLKDSENQVIIVNFDLKTGDRKEIFKIN